MRRIGHNGRYEDEVEFLRLRNAELEARVHELEDDLEKILVRDTHLLRSKHQVLLPSFSEPGNGRCCFTEGGCASILSPI